MMPMTTRSSIKVKPHLGTGQRREMLVCPVIRAAADFDANAISCSFMKSAADILPPFLTLVDSPCAHAMSKTRPGAPAKNEIFCLLARILNRARPARSSASLCRQGEARQKGRSAEGRSSERAWADLDRSESPNLTAMILSRIEKSSVQICGAVRLLAWPSQN